MEVNPLLARQKNRNRFESNPKKTFLFFFIFLTVLIFGVGEWVTRKLAPQFVAKDLKDFYSDDDDLGWTYKKDAALEAANPFDEKAIKLKFNAQGFREKDLSEITFLHEPKILFVGDSVTGAVQVNEEDRFSNRIEGRFAGRVRCVNFGVNGYGTDTALMVLEHYLAKVHPRVVVYTFVENDLMENGISEYIIAPHSYGRPTYNVNADGSLIYKPKPYKKRKMTGAALYYNAMVTLKEKSAFFALLVTQLKAVFHREAQGVHADQARVLAPKDKALLQRVPLESFRAGLDRWQLFETYLKHMKQVVEKNGSQLLVVPFIGYVHVQPYIRNLFKDVDFTEYLRRAEVIAVRNHIPFVKIDLTQALEYQKKTGPLHYVRDNVIFDGHLTEAGHAFYAQQVGAALEKILKNSLL